MQNYLASLIGNGVILVTPSADGTAGQGLKTDGAGNLSFVSFALAAHSHALSSLTGTTDDIAEGVANLYFTNARADARITAQKGAANGLATLGSDSKIPSSQLPAIAVTDTFVVASQAAMLALSAETGDVAVRTDQNKSYILKGTSPSTLADWQELLTPTDTVLSVNGQTGSVVLTTSSITEGTNLYYTDVRADARVTTGLTGRSIGTTAPLAGGGNLSADRTLTIGGLTSVGTSGQMLRSTGAAWEYRSAAQVLSDIGGAASAHTHAASDIASGTIATARLGSGVADSTTYLRGDQTWATPAAAIAIGSSVTSGTVGSVLFVGTGPALAQNNANLFWDNTNSRLGIGTAVPQSKLDVGGGITTLCVGSAFADVRLSASQNSEGGMELRNTNTGTAAGYRFSVSDDAADAYLSFFMPATTNTGTLFGRTRSTICGVFNNKNAGAGRALAIGTVAANTLFLGTNNTERFTIASDGTSVVAAIGGTTYPRFGCDSTQTGVFMSVRHSAVDVAYMGTQSASAADSNTTNGSIGCSKSGGGLGIFTSASTSRKWFIDSSGNVTHTPVAATSGAVNHFKITGAANTGQTASTEAVDVDFALNRTVTWSTGNITTQRAMVLRAPTWAAAGSSTITDGYTCQITGAPVAGTNVTITNPYALGIGGGNVQLAGGVNVVCGTTTGSKIATSASQLIGFYGATPIAQPAGAAQGALTDSTTGSTANATINDVGAAFSQSTLNDNFAKMVRLVNELRYDLTTLGLIKGAA